MSKFSNLILIYSIASFPSFVFAAQNIDTSHCPKNVSNESLNKGSAAAVQPYAKIIFDGKNLKADKSSETFNLRWQMDLKESLKDKAGNRGYCHDVKYTISNQKGKISSFYGHSLEQDHTPCFFPNSDGSGSTIFTTEAIKGFEEAIKAECKKPEYAGRGSFGISNPVLIKLKVEASGKRASANSKNERVCWDLGTFTSVTNEADFNFQVNCPAIILPRISLKCPETIKVSATIPSISGAWKIADQNQTNIDLPLKIAALNKNNLECSYQGIASAPVAINLDSKNTINCKVDSEKKGFYCDKTN